MMTPSELAKVLNYVDDKHGWKEMYTNHKEGRKVIKYVDVVFDSRDGMVWCITFREISGSRLPQDKDSVTFKEEECTEENIMRWLADNGKENPTNQ